MRPVTLDVGRVGDRLALTGVNGDERDRGVTYRWTTPRAALTIPGWGGVQQAHIEVTARNGRTRAGGQPDPAAVVYTADIGGREAAALAAGPAWVPALADLTRRPDGNADLVLTLRAPRYAAGGDPRALGVQIDRISVTPVQADWLAGAVSGWSWAARLALFAVATTVAFGGRWRGLFGGGVALAVALAVVSVPDARLVLPPLLVPVAAVLAGWVAARRLWRDRGRVVAARERLAAFAEWRGVTTTLAALDRAAVARVAVATLILAYAIGALLVIARVDFIGHADYADNAVRARNIVAGRGDVVDYVTQFYRSYPISITHPAETWPPLQLYLIALAFRLFGVSTEAAKLPNVAVMAGLLAFVAAVGAWRWGRREGVLATVFLAANLPFFAGTLMPLNDLAFALLFGCFAVAVYIAWAQSEQSAENAERGHAQRIRISLPTADRRLPTIIGVTAGLLMLAKPSGAVLAVGAAGAALRIGHRNGRSLRQWGLGVLITVGAAAATYAPWAVRNLVTFGVPFYSTETYDAWVLKYDRTDPTEGIYRVFAGGELPHPRVLIGYGVDHFLAVQWREVTRFAAGLTDGSLVPGVVLAFALLGMVVGGQVAARRGWGFGGVLAGAFALYTPFVLFYWHYESRYFLVAVPWLCLYAARGLLWAADALGATLMMTDARSRAGAVRVLPLLLVVAVVLAVAVPGARGIAEEAHLQTGGAEAVVIGRWLAENTPPDAVVMTRNPWEVSWHSGRRAVMLPLGTADEIYATMRRYNVTVLQLDHLRDTTTIRWSVEDLYRYREQPGITRLHYDPDANGTSSYLIYRVDPAALPSK